MATHLSLKILVIGDENVGKTTIVNYFTLVPIKNTSTVGIDFQSRIVALSADENCLDIGDDKSNISNISNKNNKNNISNKSNISNNIEAESETLLLSTMKVDVNVKSTLSKPALYDYVKCYFWDTSGAPHYQSLANTYYRDIAAVVVVFDLSNRHSYDNLNSYIRRVIQKNVCNHNHPILVLGNKLDKRSNKLTKRQIYECLCFDFPHEKIKYSEVSCVDKLDSVYSCDNCICSSDIHSALTTFIQFAYDSAVKPHYYNPQAIAAIGCRGINGTSRFFKERDPNQKDYKNKGWFSNFSYNNNDCNKEGKEGIHVPLNNYANANVKTPRECCGENGLQRVYETSTSGMNCAGCSMM
jgi:small GTP-binding protein